MTHWPVFSVAFLEQKTYSPQSFYLKYELKQGDSVEETKQQ